MHVFSDTAKLKKKCPYRHKNKKMPSKIANNRLGWVVFSKGLSVNEDYNYLWMACIFDVETFEFSVPAKFVLMTWSVYKIFVSSECGVSFYWGPVRVNFDSSLFWMFISKTDPTFITKYLTKTKTIVEWAFQILLMMNFLERLEIKHNFQQPLSSDSPLLQTRPKPSHISYSVP